MIIKTYDIGQHMPLQSILLATIVQHNRLLWVGTAATSKLSVRVHRAIHNRTGLFCLQKKLEASKAIPRALKRARTS